MEELREIISALWITDELHWDIALYLIFALNLVLLLMQPDGSPLAVGLCILVMVAAVIDKTKAFGYIVEVNWYRFTREQCHEQVFIGTYLIRVVMFAAPLSVAGMTKNPSSRWIGIVAGILGGIYMFVRWYLEQRDVGITDLFCAYFFSGFAFQYAGLTLAGARIALGDRLLLGRVHRHAPFFVARELAPDEVEVELA